MKTIIGKHRGLFNQMTRHITPYLYFGRHLDSGSTPVASPRNIPPQRSLAFRNMPLTRTSINGDSSILTQAKRATNRNNVATNQKSIRFFMEGSPTGSRYAPPRKILPPQKNRMIFGLQLRCFGLQLASLALGLRTLVGTGLRQRHISQSQASLGGNSETAGVEPSGENMPVTKFSLPESMGSPQILRNFDFFI